jgi:uncharacterized protein YndB with AHSA1/START domain
MAVSGTFTKTIDAPPATVWPWIGQLEKHAEWSPKSYRVELVSGEPGAVGSRYRSVGWVPGDKEHTNEVEIVAMVPEQRLELKSEDPQGTFTNTYALRPAGNGTEVTYDIVFPEMKGLLRLMLPVLFPLIAKTDIRKRLDLLKQKAEATG